MTEISLTPQFRHIADMADQQLVLRPLVDAYLIEAKFPDRFDVTFHKAGEARQPDGWFHPSTHPTMQPRLLYYYLTAGADLEQERLDYESRMAITMGIAVHGFVQMCLRDMGVMVDLPAGDCPACRRPHGLKKNQCDEFGAADPVIGSRGHMDGVISVQASGTRWEPGIGGLEFKTTNPNAARNIVENDVDFFRQKWPVYYAQVQEYMEISGLRQFIVLMAVLGYPWRLVEFQIPYNPGWNMQVHSKYRLVREHQEMGLPPDVCTGCFPQRHGQVLPSQVRLPHRSDPMSDALEEMRARLAAQDLKRKRPRKKAWEPVTVADLAYGKVLSFDQTVGKTGFSVVLHHESGLAVLAGDVLVPEVDPALKGFEQTLTRATAMYDLIEVEMMRSRGEWMTAIVHEMPSVMGYRIESSLLGALDVRLTARRCLSHVPVHMVSKQAVAALLVPPDRDRSDKAEITKAVNALVPGHMRETKRWNQDVHDSVANAIYHLYQQKKGQP